jgi:hypothetical protein
MPAPKGRRKQYIACRPQTILTPVPGKTTMFSLLELAKAAVLRTIKHYNYRCGKDAGLRSVADYVHPENYHIVNIYSSSSKPRHYIESATDKELREAKQ